MMASPFLSLVKEEPESDTQSDASRQIPICSNHTVPNLHEPLAGIAIHQSGMPHHPLSRNDIDVGLEPVTRARSYTWPQCPEALLDNEETVKIEPPLGERRVPTVPAGGLGVIEHPGAAPKKNTSRRNPWGNMSYADLIAQAILSSQEGRATLSQIYDWMVQNIPYFKDKGDSNSSAGWKNSIRHNLSLHNRFMRMQNEGTGKSSWWVLNPDAKPGKSTRRRANTLEGASGRLEKPNRRGRGVKKREPLRNGLDATPSPNPHSEGLDLYPESPITGHHPPFQLSPPDFRPRVSSNASSCGGRLTPMPPMDSDMLDVQVPPVSPNMPVWPNSEYWNPQGPPHGPPHGHGPQHPFILGSHHERYSEQLAVSMSEQLKINGGETWGNPHLLPKNSSDCAKFPSGVGPHAHVINSHTHHFNGMVTHHHLHHHNHQLQGFNNYDEFAMFGPHGPHSIASGFVPHQNMEKMSNHNRHIQAGYSIPTLQPLSPQLPSAHSISPPEPHSFPSQNHDPDLPQTPSFCSSPSILHHHPQSKPQNLSENQTSTASQTPTTSHIHSPSSCAVLASSSTSSSQCHVVSSPPPLIHRVPSHHSNSNSNHNSQSHLQQHNPSNSNSPPEATTMLKVALSHREASNLEGNQSASGSKQGVASGGHPQGGACGGGPTTDFVDLDAIQEAPFDCNVDEVIKHEMQYEDHDFSFDFAQNPNGFRDPNMHPYYNRGRDAPSQMANGTPGVMQSYNRHSIAACGGNGGNFR